MTIVSTTFIVDCSWCQAKVAVRQDGISQTSGADEESREPFAHKLVVGKCPSCGTLLAGYSEQIRFEGYDAHEDRWSDVVRVFPSPAKTFSSSNIPKVVRDSLAEADRCVQSRANIAACVMLGRAVEALCRDRIPAEPKSSVSGKQKPLMLGAGLKRLKEMGIIDSRLYDWSQQLQAFRNLAAHPEDINISRQDATDLQTFVNAIIEYVYDLTERYEEFKTRVENRGKKKSRGS